MMGEGLIEPVLLKWVLAVNGYRRMEVIDFCSVDISESPTLKRIAQHPCLLKWSWLNLVGHKTNKSIKKDKIN